MLQQFDIFSFINTLISFSPRQLKGETQTAQFLIDYLKKLKIPFSLEIFYTQIPFVKRAKLKCDGKYIPCKGTSFISGNITCKDYLVSSLIGSKFFLTHPNINFNPKCSAISLANFYFAPSLAINKNDITKILEVKKVIGEIKVRRVKHRSMNILVGNKMLPKNIVFAHYDSIETGAIDNASGVAVMMSVIISYPELLKHNLFVFCGNEELSYDKPTYWGHGFRVFEKKHLNILTKSKKILVIDCVGNGRTKVYRNKTIQYLAFPIMNTQLLKKTFIIAGDLEQLMTVYHSSLDTVSQLHLKFLKEASNILIKYLTS